MAVEIKDVLRAYAEKKAKVKQIEADLEEMKPLIIEHLAQQGVDKLPTSLGTFTVSERSTWKYSPAVEKLQEEEKQRGIATKKVSTTLTFNEPKDGKQK